MGVAPVQPSIVAARVATVTTGRAVGRAVGRALGRAVGRVYDRRVVFSPSPVTVGLIVSAMCFLLGSAKTVAAQQADSARAGVRTTSDSTPTGVVRGVAPSRRRAKAARDSLEAPVSPGKAFLLSLALPGLGQSRLDRPTAGAVYFVAEALSLAMLGKSAHDLRIAKEHLSDVTVNSYAVDPTTGKPQIVDGKYVAKDTSRSRYADPVGAGAVGGAQQQRSRVKARRLHYEDWIAMLIFNHLFSGADAFVSSQLWDLPAQVEMRALPRGAGIGLSITFR